MGKLIEYINDDVDSMRKEYRQWSKIALQSQKKIDSEKKVSEK